MLLLTFSFLFFLLIPSEILVVTGIESPKRALLPSWKIPLLQFLIFLQKPYLLQSTSLGKKKEVYTFLVAHSFIFISNVGR